MIGTIRKIITPYYDNKVKKMRFKSRPALILKEVKGDYVVLPISKIGYQQNVDPEYDLKIEIIKFPNLHLNVDSDAYEWSFVESGIGYWCEIWESHPCSLD